WAVRSEQHAGYYSDEDLIGEHREQHAGYCSDEDLIGEHRGQRHECRHMGNGGDYVVRRKVAAASRVDVREGFSCRLNRFKEELVRFTSG
ncbi:hypothetical protein BHE74_00022614, partial [Ensete ventricosum]